MSPARRRRPTAGAVRARTAEQIARTPLGPRPVPGLSSLRRVREPSIQEQTTASGLQVVAIRRPATPLVELRLRIPFAGSREHHPARSELLAETILLGTAGTSREDVDQDLADAGGQLHASVDPQRLLLSGSVLANGLDRVLEVLAAALTSAAHRRTDVDGERDRLVEYLRLAQAQPEVVARTALQDRRFGNHPAAREMPDADDVRAVTAAQVRGLHRRAVVPRGSTLVLVGDLTPARALELASTMLGDWTGSRPATMLAAPPAVRGGELIAVHRPGSVQSQIRLTATAPTRDDPDHAAFVLANLVFGGYFSSRLVENIREDKGYTYSAHSSVEYWPGRAAVTVSFDTTTDVTAAALWEARYEAGRLALVPPEESEIASARSYVLGALALSTATQAGYASTVSALAGVGLGPSWLTEHRARLTTVTAEEVAAAAARHLAPTAFTGVIVGDLDAIGPALRRVGGVRVP